MPVDLVPPIAPAPGAARRDRRPGIDLGTGPLWRSLLIFVIPSLGSSFLQSASQTILAILIGRLIGVEGLAVISTFFPIGFFVLSFMFGLATASSILISQANGAGDIERVQRVAGTSIALSLVISIVISLIGGIFTSDIFTAARTPDNIFADTVSYARIMFIAQPLTSFYITFVTMLRGTGDAQTPFYALLLSTIITIVGTIAFIQGWGGLPSFGINSGAYALLISYVVTFVITGIYLRWHHHPLAPTWDLFRQVRLNWTILKTLFRLGVPMGVQLVLISLSEIAVLSFVNHYGSTATAAFGAVNQIVSYVQMPAVSVGIAASIFGAHVIGRGEQQRLSEITRTAILLNFTIGGLTIIAGYLFERPLMGLFITDRATLEMALHLLNITLWSYIVFGMTIVIASVMRASGTVLVPTSISVLTIWAVQVPIAYLLSRSIGLDGIWIAYPISFLTALLLQSSYFMFVWRHKTFKRLV